MTDINRGAPRSTTMKWWDHPDIVGATVASVDPMRGLAIFEIPNGDASFVVDLWSDTIYEERTDDD